MPSLTDDLSWLKTHLALLALVAGLTYGGVYLIESKIADHDKQTAAVMQAQNSQFQAQVQQEIQSLQAQNAQLAQALSQRQMAEASIPPKVGSLTPAQVGFDISEAAQSKPSAVTVQGNTITLDLPTAQIALADMQLVPMLQADKKDLQTQLSNETKMYEDEVSAHKKDNETNALQVKALKAEARRSKLRWFGVGYVAGFVSARVLGI